MGARRIEGSCVAKTDEPSMNTELVSRTTSQLIAIICIHVPMSERSLAGKEQAVVPDPRVRKREKMSSVLLFDGSSCPGPFYIFITTLIFNPHYCKLDLQDYIEIPRAILNTSMKLSIIMPVL